MSLNNIINQFNAFNGQEVSLSQVQSIYAELANLVVPMVYNPTIEELTNRLALLIEELEKLSPPVATVELTALVPLFDSGMDGVATQQRSKKRRALFLDLDGTVRQSKAKPGGPIKSHHDIELVEGIKKKVTGYKKARYLIYGITNQGGVAHGHKTVADVVRENDRTNELMDGMFNKIFYAPNDPDGTIAPYNQKSELTKPKTGMLELAQKHAASLGLSIDLPRSLVVGNTTDDTGFAHRAGIPFKTTYHFLNPKVKRKIPAAESMIDLSIFQPSTQPSKETGLDGVFTIDGTRYRFVKPKPTKGLDGALQKLNSTVKKKISAQKRKMNDSLVKLMSEKKAVKKPATTSTSKKPSPKFNQPPKKENLSNRSNKKRAKEPPKRLEKTKPRITLAGAQVAPPAPQTIQEDESASFTPKGLVSAAEIMKTNFETLPFPRRWLKLIPKPFEGFNTMIYGKPKNGKTSFSMQFADMLTQFGRVLYNASDQGTGATMQDVIKETRIGSNPNVHFGSFKTVKELRKYLDSNDYQFVFIDLMNNYNIKAAQMEAVLKDYPNISFNMVFETTKTGEFRGAMSWQHLPDQIIQVEEFIAHSHGRLGQGEFAVWPERYPLAA